MRFLSDAPLDLFSLAMFPSDQIFLKASNFTRTLGGIRAVSAQGYVNKALSSPGAPPAMDFSRSGVTERVGVSFRAHVQWNDKGKRQTYGPHCPAEEAAQRDLER